MAIERERKFLVELDRLDLTGITPNRIAQAYLLSTDDVEVRVRLEGSTSTLTIKTGDSYISREEEEFLIESPVLGAGMFDGADLRIHKDRYSVVYGAHGWEIDVFLGPNEGLILAEVEFGLGESIQLPPWCGAEVTGDSRYYNRRLAREPFATWD